MADTILAYFLYESDLGREAKADIVESFYSLSGVDPTEPLERIREHLDSLPHVYVSLRYESIQPAFVAIPEKNRNLFPELSQMRLHISEEHYQPGLVTDEEVTEHICDFVDLAVHTYEASRKAGYEPRYVLGADPD